MKRPMGVPRGARTTDKTRDFRGIAQKPRISPCQPVNSSCPLETGSALSISQNVIQDFF